jgi:hypothetical protein
MHIKGRFKPFFSRFVPGWYFALVFALSGRNGHKNAPNVETPGAKTKP